MSFTETDVEEFFDRSLSAYLSFWDSEGVLHTGYFAGAEDEDYGAASDRTSQILAADAGIDGSSHVLDVGCGCGNFMVAIADRVGCRGVGLDLSEERIKVAREKVAGEHAPDVRFDHGSATQLPYPDGEFSHAVSQDALFLVPDKPRSHAEIHRVLRPGGILAFSDFLQPRPDVSERARTHVFDRVRWNSGYSFTGYQTALEAAGFEILLARNVTDQIGQTYRVLGKTATRRAQTATEADIRDWMLAFAVSCQEIQIAIADGEFGWGMYVARKPAREPARGTA